jgi:hypothetical protein
VIKKPRGLEGHSSRRAAEPEKITINNPFAVYMTSSGLIYTGVFRYPRVIRSKTYRGYVKPQITPNAIYNMIFV